VLSGFSQPQFKNLSMACGADGFLVKPLDFDLLEKYLERYLIRHYRKSH
jgi:YesN/AraC family two-component response regulator